LTHVADLVGHSADYLCQHCRDTGWEYTSKGVRPCRCRMINLYQAIPEEYRALVADFQPNAMQYPKQAKAFEAMRQNPRQSFLLAGEFGSGKTALGWWQIRKSIETGRNWRYVRLPDLLDEFRLWENTDRKAKTPTLHREHIQYTNDLLIVLDEIDKVYGVEGATEFAMRKLLQIVDAAYQWRRQIIFLSNLSSGQLEAKYTKVDEISGYAVMRRMMQMCEELEMF